LHIIEGDLPAHRLPLVPGHQVIARIKAVGQRPGAMNAGDLVGLGWLHASCGTCRFCRERRENLCDRPVFTGYDVDGGFSRFMKARAEFLYRLPSGLDPISTAPLLCAGIIGMRALRLSGIRPGGRLAIYGFGGSAHVTIQVARHWRCEAHVFTRRPSHRRLALELGASTAAAAPASGSRFDAAILFAPAGELVPTALEHLDKGGTLAVAGIHLSEVPPLDYQRHLFYEKHLVSVTANTREDGLELLRLAQEIPLQTRTKAYPLEQANKAILDLKEGRVDGSAVLVIG
jgi:propanol-preferring alcohol dehydrogenase